MRGKCWQTPLPRRDAGVKQQELVPEVRSQQAAQSQRIPQLTEEKALALLARFSSRQKLQIHAIVSCTCHGNDGVA